MVHWLDSRSLRLHLKRTLIEVFVCSAILAVTVRLAVAEEPGKRSTTQGIVQTSPRGSTVSGKVVDAATHLPLSDQIVAAGSERAATDESGHFELKNVAAVYDLLVVSPDRGKASVYRKLTRRDPWLIHSSGATKARDISLLEPEECIARGKKPSVWFTAPKSETALSPGAQFTWSAVPQSMYALHLAPKFFQLATSPQIDVYTSEPTARWPDLLSLGVFFPQLTQTQYDVSIVAEGPYTSMDDATGPGGLSAKRSTQYCCSIASQLQCYASAESDSVGTKEYWRIDSPTSSFGVKMAADASKYHCAFEERDLRPGDMIYQCGPRRCGCAIIDGKAQPYCSDGNVLEPRPKGSGGGCWPGDLCCQMKRAAGGR